LETCNINAIIDEQQKKKLELGAYFDVLIRVNSMAFKEACEMRTATFEEVFTEAGIIPRWIEMGRQEGISIGIEQGIDIGIERLEKTAQNLLAMGMSVEETARATELPVEKVRSLSQG